MRAAISWPTTGTIPEPCSIISATRTSSTPSDTPSFHPTGSATSGEISWIGPFAGTAGTDTVWPANSCATIEIAQFLCETPRRGDFRKVKITPEAIPECLHFFGSGLRGATSK